MFCYAEALVATKLFIPKQSFFRMTCRSHTPCEQGDIRTPPEWTYLESEIDCWWIWETRCSNGLLDLARGVDEIIVQH
jgi:hypothetical protein